MRFDRRFDFDAWTLAVYLDVQNVYHRANVEVVAYSFDYRVSTPLTGLPVVPSIGLRAEF